MGDLGSAPANLSMTVANAGTAAPGAPDVFIGRQLACRRGCRLLFADLDIRLEPGTVIWLRGTNGSGKTSLLRILAGLSRAESGEVARPPGQVVYVGHANGLKDDLTLGEALGFHARLQGVPQAERRVHEALDRLGIAARHDALVRTLSQGQRRRGALARLALDDTPRVWLLDEPFDALDDDGIARVSALIEANVARGGAVLLTSHQPVALAGRREFDLARTA